MDLTEIISKISGVTSNSSEVKKDFAFVAVKGNTNDGHDYIDIAINNGAKFVIYDHDISYNYENDIYIKVEDSRKALAFLASEFYKDQPNKQIAVTGTNGKSSIVSFVTQIGRFCNIKSASVGTVGVDGFVSECNLTTPDAVSLFKMLKEAKMQNIELLSIEASSIGLHQHRIDGIKLSAAGFSNITHDHLDYHKTFDKYLEAKLYLFTDILKNGVAVINADMQFFPEIYNICKQHNHQIITYGKNGEDIKLHEIKIVNSNSFIKFSIKENVYSLEVKLIGEFQIYNLLCAVGLAIAAGFDQEKIIESLPTIKNVRGRMEKVDKSDKEIYIDYAHTPDAIENALKSIRPYCRNKLIILFGSGGDRDKTKRSIMGEVANKFADIVIVTDDNSRSEDPSNIRKDILKGCPNAIEIAGREEAIKYAINHMEEGDLLLIAGRGHEQYLIIGNNNIKFCDFEIAKKYS